MAIRLERDSLYHTTRIQHSHHSTDPLATCSCRGFYIVGNDPPDLDPTDTDTIAVHPSESYKSHST